ncbi:MAG: hypothetical protein CMD23_01160 [Flavobacteriales bacterium]|nr:hypothetical protein [Flavobacteriales bacterium]
MRNLFTVCLIIFLTSSCAISNIKFDAIKPAEINVPSHIESVVIVNRTAPTKNNKVENILDGIISGEMIGVDKRSSKDCINSLKLEMSNSPRFKLISTESIEFKGSGTAEMSKPLKWEKIEKSLKNYDADGLIVLESFDSSSQVRELGTRQRKKKINGEWKKIKEHIASLDVEVQAGWRIYDIKNKKIIDEKRFFDRKVFENSDKTMVLAKQNLPGLDYAVSQAGIFSGQQFYYRISPHYITINREYFKNLRQIKGFKIKSDNSNNLFINASNHISNKNWKQAVEIWKPFTSHKNRFIASRACFNMALASEASGNIDIALSWVNKSIKLGNKKAKTYLKRLEKRKIDLAILEKQIID